VWKVAWSRDGTRIATAGEDGTAKLWDAKTGEELLTIIGHEGSVEGVAFNADGTLLATAGVDGTAKLWDVGTDDACALVRLLVTTAELRDALGGSEPIACTDLRS
jgi:WD40 repeat protein